MIAAPCEISLYLWCASIAWPKVCPKFNIALIPLSFSSKVTIFDLVLMDSVIISLRIFSSLETILLALFWMIFLSLLLPMKAYLTTSPKPDLYWESDNVCKKKV